MGSCYTLSYILSSKRYTYPRETNLMPNVATELVIVRNEFYSRSYQQIKHIVLVLLLITILLIGYYIHLKNVLKPMPRYFPTTPDGRLIYSPPYDINHLLLSEQTVNPDTGIIVGMPEPTQKFSDLQPYGENALVLYWAYVAVTEMFDLDFVHYKSVIQEASKFFTAKGHVSFIEALIASKNIETVIARRAVVIPKVTGAIQLIDTFMAEGHYAWHIKVPLQLTYTSAGLKVPIVQQLVANMFIGRVSTLRSPFYGLNIYQLYFEAITDNQGA